MSHKTILGGFAAAAVGLSMLGGALPASATTTTSFAPAGQSSFDHRDHHKNKCWDVDFFRHRGHWDVTWKDNDGWHREHARSYRDAVDELFDHCDRIVDSHRHDRDHDKDHRDHDRDHHRDHRDHDRDHHRDHRDHDRDHHRDHGDHDKDHRDHKGDHDRDHGDHDKDHHGDKDHDWKD